MGNHHGHNSNKTGESAADSSSSNNSRQSSTKKTISRTVSGNDIQERQTSQLLPVERLAKVSTILRIEHIHYEVIILFLG